MFCTECGTELPEDAIFCTNCGCRVSGTVATAPASDAATGTSVTTDADASDEAETSPNSVDESGNNAETPDGDRCEEATTVLPHPVSRDVEADADPTMAVDSTTLMPKPAPNAEDDSEEKQDAKRPRKKGPIIAAIVIAVLVVAGVAGFLVWNRIQEQERQAAWDAAHEEKTLAVGIDAEGLVASNGSMIPIHITGTDLDDKAVDTVAYVDEDGENIKLLQGTYQLSIPASPFAEDGTLYTVPSDAIEVEVTEDTSTLVGTADFTLTPIDPIDVTDQQIDDAYQYAIDGGCDEDQADALRDAATERRDDAVEAKEEAEAREAAAAFHIAADSFELDVPAYWRGKVTWNVSDDTVTFYSKSYPDRELVTLYWKGDSVGLRGDAMALGGMAAEDSSGAVIAYSGPAYSQLIPMALRTGSTAEEDYYTEDEADELIELQSGGAADYDDALSDYDSSTSNTDSIVSDYLSTAFNVRFR